MEEFDLKELFKYYFKRLPIILLITLLSLEVGVYYNEKIQKPMYKASSTLILVQSNETTPDGIEVDTQKDVTLAKSLVSTYSEIVKSRRVLEQVIEELNLDMSSSGLASKITVSSVQDTAILKLSVVDTNNELATDIANVLTEVFKKEVSQIYKLKNVSTIDDAVIEDVPYNVSKTKQLITFSLIGFVISCGIIFIIFYFDTTVKSAEEIELRLQLPVLAKVPKANTKRKKTFTSGKAGSR